MELAADVAADGGIADGDLVKLHNEHGAVTAHAVVDPDLAPKTVALRLGGGRSFVKEPPLSGNGMALLGLAVDPLSGQAALYQGMVNQSVLPIQP